MIDLSKRILPSAVEVGGEYYRIKTDYRYWLRFMQLLRPGALYGAFDFLYEDEIPQDRNAGLLALQHFAEPNNILPRGTGSDSGCRVLDYDIDSDYIYAAFLEQYGIDLLTVNLHYHIFRALLNGLHETKLNEIITDRLYTGDNAELRKARRAWELPDDEDETRALEEFNMLFKENT